MRQAVQTLPIHSIIVSEAADGHELVEEFALGRRKAQAPGKSEQVVVHDHLRLNSMEEVKHEDLGAEPVIAVNPTVKARQYKKQAECELGRNF